MICLYDKFENYIPITTCIKQRSNGDFLIVMSEKTDIYYLNDTARFIYENIDGVATISVLFNKMKNEYNFGDIPMEAIKKDFVELIRDIE